MKRVAQLLLPLLFVCSVFARDGVRPPVTGEARTSEFDPEKEGDTLFVVDDGSGLDTGCSYRTDGPLEIRLRIRRYVGPVNPDGTLQNPEALIDEGVRRVLLLLLARRRFERGVDAGEVLPRNERRIAFAACRFASKRQTAVGRDDVIHARVVQRRTFIGDGDVD